MAKEKQLLIEVRDKIATLKSKNFNLVGGNNDYDVVFDFDEDWQDLNAKTAIFVFDNENPVYVPFEGNVCVGVAINDATMCLIGVFSGDLRTTTPAVVDCVYRSILDEANGTPAPPKEDVYNQIIELINGIGEINAYTKEESDAKFAHLVDGKVPAENIPTAAFDIIRGYFNSGGTDFHVEGEHNEEVGADGYYVVPRQGVFYFDMSAPNAEAPFAGAVCIWRGNGYEKIATVVEFEAALQSMKQSIDLKIEDVEQDVYALNGQIGDISTALDKSNAYDIIVTSEEQFLSERANFIGKRVLFKDTKFTLQEMDFNYAEYIAFCNVAVGSTSFEVRIRNFKFGNFAGFTRGWSDSNNMYYCDDLYVEDFAFAENLIPHIDSVHGSGDNIIYSNGLGIMNCAITSATNCCNIVNCHLIGRQTLYFTNCTSISNLHAKSIIKDVVFENCTHLSNIALLESGSTFAITYTNCSDVDPDTCDGYEGSGSRLPAVSDADEGKILRVVGGIWQTAYPDVDKAYVDGLVGDISTALDELHAYAQSLVTGGNA